MLISSFQEDIIQPLIVRYDITNFTKRTKPENYAQCRETVSEA